MSGLRLHLAITQSPIYTKWVLIARFVIYLQK